MFLIATQQTVVSACDFCLGNSPFVPSGPNTYWSLVDNLTACPAGDSVTAGHPARLRIEVWYDDVNCAAKVGVPPESLWVTYATLTGNLLVNDQGVNVYADDSTDVCGHTWITIPSFSGCGTLRVTFYVSGISQGFKDVTVRTTDTNADGRATAADIPPCDLNYDGAVTGADGDLVNAHPQHWHRQALHGTLVRRTTLNDAGPADANNSIGDGGIGWSPDGLRVVYSSRDHCPSCPNQFRNNPCRIKWVWADAARGNVAHNLTYNSTCPAGPCDSMDYDPSWSPRGTSVYYVRGDRVIRRKGVPGLDADTSQAEIFRSDIPKEHAQISPSGDSLAFVQADASFRLQVFIVPAVGGAARQLTTDLNASWLYPYWSPDGSYLTATRQLQVEPFTQSIWKIRVQGPPSPTLYYGPMNADASHSAVAPDSQALVAFSAPDGATPHRVHVMDGTAPVVPDSKQTVENYPRYTYAGPFPRFSPDGTRLALLAINPDVSGANLPQLWAARRNMNLAPAFTSVTSDLEGTRSIADTAAVMPFEIAPRGISHISVLASDPEGDGLTYLASFLQPWMTWLGGNRTLAMNPPASARNKDFVVKFWVTTVSGGTDSFIASIHVGATLGASAQSALPTAEEQPPGGLTGAPQGALAVFAPLVTGESARLMVFDIAGRRVAVVRAPSGSWLTWDGKNRKTGRAADSGIYLYRLEVGDRRLNGKVLVRR